MRHIPTAIAAFIGLAILSVVLGSWYTVDEGERGVILRYGAVAGVAQPGLGFKIPLIDSVVRVSVQSKAAIYNGMEAYSRDQQPATMNLSVNYRIPPDRVKKFTPPMAVKMDFCRVWLNVACSRKARLYSVASQL